MTNKLEEVNHMIIFVDNQILDDQVSKSISYDKIMYENAY